MIGLPLAFAQPLLLTALIALPALWWLLRLVPPRPRQVNFPPAQILFEIRPKEETPARTPWWLTLLRLLLAAAIILVAAGPVWNPKGGAAAGRGPLVLLVDDGWSAAATFTARLDATDEYLGRAEAEDRPVALVPFSEALREISLQPASTARVAIRQLQPRPWHVARGDLLPVLARFAAATAGADYLWLSDGTRLNEDDGFAAKLADTLKEASLTVVVGGLAPPLALVGADNLATQMVAKVVRPAGGEARAGTVRALDLKGLTLGEAPFVLAPQATEADVHFDLPLELRNDIARLDIAGERSAGAVQLLDKRARRRAIGITTGASIDTAQPLLAAQFYLSRALSPFADLRIADRGAASQAIGQFIDQKLPAMALADVGTIPPELRDRLSRWIEDGGVLLRFAGPRLAAAEDDFVPVRLRRGGRVLGGALTWEKPQPLAAFSAKGPFAGLAVPEEVTVTRQVLAEPDATLTERTWASLADGTPLVTAEQRGKGLVVLFHVTADTRWSNLPLSGTFVEMLRRVVNLAGAVTPEAADTAEGAANTPARQTAPPTRMLDGYGAFTAPPPQTRPLPVAYADRATGEHPAGYYGPQESLIAVNVLAPADRPAPLDLSALKAQFASYATARPLDLRGPLLAAALALFLLDALLMLWLSGGLSLMRRRTPRAAVLALAGIVALGTLITSDAADAQTRRPSPSRPAQAAPPPRAPAADAPSSPDTAPARAALQTRLAYVQTGRAEVDAITHAGLQSLTLFLAQRTALEAADPVAIDPSRDELAFYPLIYWPVLPDAPKPPAAALEKIDAYMKQGGTVLFDTRDALDSMPGPDGLSQSPAQLALRSILSSLDIPELEPVPREHVLAKTFYLLRDFPGRFTTGTTWVEALPAASDEENDRPARGGDGVSSIIITSNDLAGAWALQPDGRPMLPLVPDEPRQREFAFRTGVNIVMYTLTGNYKADQVHMPALIERLGQ